MENISMDDYFYYFSSQQDTINPPVPSNISPLLFVLRAVLVGW
jgi:hypothetical protein